MKWLTAAAEQGQIQTQTKLGLMLAAGGDLDDPRPDQNVPKDYVSAYMWLDLAAAGGEARAQEERPRNQDDGHSTGRGARASFANVNRGERISRRGRVRYPGRWRFGEAGIDEHIGIEEDRANTRHPYT
jgi:TPR repeat protein